MTTRNLKGNPARAAPTMRAVGYPQTDPIYPERRLAGKAPKARDAKAP